MNKMKGQAQAGIILAVALASSIFAGGASWMVNYLFNSPAEAQTAIVKLNDKVAEIKNENNSKNAVQDEQIKQLTGDISEIKSDVKSLLKGLGIKNNDAKNSQ